MAGQWKTVRLPAELADRLERVAGLMLRDHVEMRAELPGEYCESVPLHHVIARTLDDWEAHRARARAPRRRKVGS